MPTIPANTPYADLSFLSFMNNFSNKFVIIMPQPNEINEYYTPKTLCFQGFPVFLNIFLKILKIMLDK
jgi:hypothetical protein